jgi:hypothetical protein
MHSALFHCNKYNRYPDTTCSQGRRKGSLTTNRGAAWSQNLLACSPYYSLFAGGGGPLPSPLSLPNSTPSQMAIPSSSFFFPILKPQTNQQRPPRPTAHNPFFSFFLPFFLCLRFLVEVSSGHVKKKGRKAQLTRGRRIRCLSLGARSLDYFLSFISLFLPIFSTPSSSSARGLIGR